MEYFGVALLSVVLILFGAVAVHLARVWHARSQLLVIHGFGVRGDRMLAPGLEVLLELASITAERLRATGATINPYVTIVLETELRDRTGSPVTGLMEREWRWFRRHWILRILATGKVAPTTALPHELWWHWFPKVRGEPVDPLHRREERRGDELRFAEAVRDVMRERGLLAPLAPRPPR